jgi:hypothetical protein
MGAGSKGQERAAHQRERVISYVRFGGSRLNALVGASIPLPGTPFRSPCPSILLYTSSTCAYAITMASHRSYQADPTPPRLSFSRYRPQNPRISPEDGERAMIVGPGRVAACPAGPPRSTEAHCRTQGVGSRPGDSRPWVPWPTGPRTDNSRVSSTARCPGSATAHLASSSRCPAALALRCHIAQRSAGAELPDP